MHPGGFLGALWGPGEYIGEEAMKTDGTVKKDRTPAEWYYIIPSWIISGQNVLDIDPLRYH